MRAAIVLAGMLVAATAAFLVWFDATGQLRPFLSTAPIVVVELDSPAIGDIAESPGASATGSEAPDGEAPDGDASDGDADVANSPSPETVAPEMPAAETATPETATPETATPETAVPETAAPETSAAAPDAAQITDSQSIENGLSSTESAEHDTDPPALESFEPESGAEPVNDAAAGMASAAIAADADTGTPDRSAETVDATEATSEADAIEPPADGTVVPPPPKPDELEAYLDAAGEPAAGATTGDTPAATQSAALPGVPSGADLPWRRYAGEFSIADPRPRIAIVFTSLGLSDSAGEAIIKYMPPGVTLAFSPYSRKLTEWIELARADGHEVLIELPMEPLNYPDDDPGPLALLSDLPVQDNITRMNGILARAEGVVGVAVHMGSRFTTSAALMRPLLAALGERGYVYVDNGAAPFSVLPTLSHEVSVPIAINDHYIDREASRIAIDGRLQQIERIARTEGAAVAFASPYPITIERLAAWIPTLEAKGFVLAPVTAVVGRQRLQ
jgi:uncharacterized protein